MQSCKSKGQGKRRLRESMCSCEQNRFQKPEIIWSPLWFMGLDTIHKLHKLLSLVQVNANKAVAYLCYLMKCWKRIGIANVFYDLCKALMMHAIEYKIVQHWKVREVVSASWSFQVVLRCLSTGARWYHATDCGTDINGTIVMHVWRARRLLKYRKPRFPALLF